MNVSIFETNIVGNDFHSPYHDHKVVANFIRFLKDFKPDILTINGDLIDFYDLSNYAKSPTRFLSMSEIEGLKLNPDYSKYGQGYIVREATQREIDESYDILVGARSAIGDKAQIKYQFGNHEFRFDNYIYRNATAFTEIRRARDRKGSAVLSIEYLLRLKELGVKTIYEGFRETWHKYGGLHIGHFDMVRKHSTWTAKSLVEDKGVCLLQAHTHRMGAFYKTTFDHTLVGYENGCLCSLTPRYIKNPNWQQGFSIVYRKKGKNRFHVHQVPIIDGMFIYEGKEYK